MSAHVAASLSAYLDGELESADRQTVEAHLHLCDECASRLLDLAAVDELARALPLEAPDGYFEALPARVRFRVTPRRRRGPRVPAWSLAVAAALLVAVVTPALLERTSKPAEVARSVAPPPAPAGAESRLDQKEQSAGPLRSAAAPAEGEERTHASRDALPSGPGKVAARHATPPAAPPRSNGVAQGTLARNEATAPLAKSDEAAAKDKLREASPAPPGRAPSTPAASEAFAAPPEASPLEGAAGQHLFEPEAERDVADAPAAVAESKKAGSAQRSATAGLQDSDAVRSERQAPRLRFRTLLAEAPGNALDARRLREQWRAFVAQGPPSTQADEGRVRIVEMGVQAWRLSNEPADLILARRDAEAYLRRDDAAQGDRVRSLLATTGN